MSRFIEFNQKLYFRFCQLSAAILMILVAELFFCPEIIYAGIKQENKIEREEKNTSSDFSFYREKSVQSVIYTHTTPFLRNEFNFRHVSYKFIPAPWFFLPAPEQHTTSNQLWQASFSGYNLTAPIEFKVGRIWAGNETYRPVDGGFFEYKWGNRLSSNFLVGKSAAVDNTANLSYPAVFEGQLRYRFNENAFLTAGTGQRQDNSHSIVQMGYSMDVFRVIGEYKTHQASETWGLNLHYFTSRKMDLIGSYRLEEGHGVKNGNMRALLGYDMGKVYLEGGTGLKFEPGQLRKENNSYYESSITWGQPNLGLDGITLGYLFERGNASAARTITGTAEKRVSKQTRIIVDLSNTRFEDSGESLQNIDSRLWRKVEWGFYELSFGFITGSTVESLQKEAKIRASMEF
ncbi:MAG: hypothetical protein HQM10_07300 [Candidatus Riflebacteria bacterium]|nr:hypothetical protein [Candidatus Riflebacteria bacterium]